MIFSWQSRWTDHSSSYNPRPCPAWMSMNPAAKPQSLGVSELLVCVREAHQYSSCNRGDWNSTPTL